MTTQALLSELQAKYPQLEFSLQKLEDLGIDDWFSEEELKELNPPETLITFDGHGVGVWDVFASSCSRFLIDPKEEYGIDVEDAEKIAKHNKIAIHAR